MPKYGCEDCGEEMDLKKGAKNPLDCPTCGHKNSMKRIRNTGMVDESVFGF